MPPIYVGDVLVSAGTGGTPPAPTPTVTLAVAPSSALEDGATNIVYTFTRTGATDAALTVNYTIGGTATNGTDYATIGTSVVIPIGSATATVTINPTTDATIEGDETVSLTLASGSYTIGTVSAVTSTITNDDVAPSLPTVTLAVAPSSALEDGGTNIVYTFTRTGSTAAPLTVNYTIGGTATNGTDYATIGTSVVIAGGSATGTVTIDPTLDATIESDETVTLTLAADAAYTVGTGGAVTATITNDDFAPGLPTVTVARTPASVLEDGAPTMAFTFTRTGSTAGSLVVDYTISGTAVNGTDYVTIATSVTIAGGSATGTVVIDPTADATIEADETVILTIAPSANYTVGSPSTATGLITNDDFPTVTIARSSGNVLEDGAGNMVFTVTRTGSTAASLLVNYTIGGTAINGTDYATIPTSITIPSASATADIVVNPTVDALLEGNETVTLTLAADAAYTVGSPASAIGLIQNDETGANVFAFASINTVIVGEAAGNATITVARSGSTAAAATVEYTISAVDGGATPVDDYTPASLLAANLGLAEFGIGDATTTISVPIVNDVTTEGAEAFAVAIVNPSSGSLGAPRTARVRIVDNDGASRISFSDSAYEVAESAGSLTVTLIRAGSTASAASVTLATTDGSAVAGVNFTAISQTVTFPIGNNVQTVVLTILDEATAFNAKSFSLGLSAATGATIDGSTTAAVQILGPGVDFAGATIETFVGGLTEPVTMRWLPGSPTTMLVAEKAGQVRVVESGVLRTEPLVDRRVQVNNNLDRGLIGMAVHPSWPAQPYVYIAYNYDPPETIGATGFAAPDASGNRPARVERLTVDPGTLVATSGTVIVGTNSIWAFISRPDLDSNGDISILPSGIVNGSTITASAGDISTGYQDNSPTQQAGTQNQNIRDYITTDAPAHGISNLEFGPDGMLYVAAGDGSSFNFVDNRAVRCQDIGNLSGKLLRVDPITGNGVPGNPYYSEASGTAPGTSNQSKVWYYGLRNAFRFTFDPVTDQPVMGDVGYGSWEEILTGPAGSNFGWPYREGPDATPGYGALAQAVAFEANGRVNAGSPNALPAVGPLRAFSHSAPDNFSSICMGQFYNANSFAYADTIDGRVFTGTMNAGRTAITPTQIATGLTYLVDIRQGPDGNLYGCQLYTTGFAPGRIMRWLPPLPVVTVAVSPSNVVEDGTPNMVFTFTRTGSTASALTVNYTIGGTATNGTDYATIGTSVVIPGGSATNTVTVNPTPDATTETGGETVILTVAASASYTVGSPGAATGTISESGSVVFPAPTMYLRLDTDFADSSANAFVPTGTPTPFRLTSTPPPIAPGFHQFDWNGGDALRFANTALLNPGTGDFTISAFLRSNGAAGLGEFPAWFTKGAYQSSTGAMAFFRSQISEAFGVGFSNPWREAQGTGGTGPGEVWTRLTVVRSGATITFYQGTTVRGTVSAAGLDLTSTSPFVVGGAATDGTDNWQGGICDFVYIRGTALTIGQITALQTATYGSLL
jgi:glucose/arabinose dehydrogenase